MSQKTYCQCEAAGDCPLLQRRMVGRDFEICQGRAPGLAAAKAQAYRDVWAKKAGVTMPASPPTSRGLGDVAEKVFRYTGVSAAVKVYEKVTGKDCGCAGRQTALNNSSLSRTLGFSGEPTAAPAGVLDAEAATRIFDPVDCDGRSAGNRHLAGYYALRAAMEGRGPAIELPQLVEDLDDEGGEPVNLYCILSQQFVGLYYDWFLRGLAAVQDPGIKLHTWLFTVGGNGDFGTDAYSRAICQRMEKLIELIDRHDGEILAFSDLDILWLRTFSGALRRALDGHDVVYQSEGRPDQPRAVNGGLFAIRCSPAVRDFYRGVLDELDGRGVLDQLVISRRLPESGLRWNLLPRQFANTNLMQGVKVEADTICYHAINTLPAPGLTSLEQKYQQFRAIEGAIGQPHAPRQSRQLVVAKYQERVEWAEQLPFESIIYDKSSSPAAGSIPLPNVGREAHTYAEHVCRNWDRLADITVFSQGNPFAHVGTGFLERAARVPDGAQYVDLVGYLLESHADGLPHHAGLPIAPVWELLFPGEPMPQRFTFGAGAIFAASREAIHRRPLAWWQRLCDFLETDQLQGAWVLERLWPIILGTT